ncbi:MAG: hypothetical protein V1701_10775 [Planctomycetota bacterium]
MQVTVCTEMVDHTKCKECRKLLRGWEPKLTGYCPECYRQKFPAREIDLPPLRRKVRGGWQRLRSPYERQQSQRWIIEIDKRIDGNQR